MIAIHRLAAHRLGRALATAAVLGLAVAGCSSGQDATPAAADPGLAVSIDGIGARSSLVPLGLNPDRTLQVPPLDQVQQAGYYSGGPRPGDPGPAVIVGHINGNGQRGVFNRLGELKAGDKIVVTRDGRPLTFTVSRTETVEKNRFPTARVYSDTPAPELRLISCGGDLDKSAHSYVSNVIAFASLDG